MEIKFEESESKGSFYIEEQGQRLGQMIFSTTHPGRMVIEHTEVDDVLKGKNAGRQLVAAGVEFARKNNLKIIPLCSFAKRVLMSTKEYQDVL